MAHSAIIVKSDNNPAFNGIREYLLASHVDFEVMHFEDDDGPIQIEHYERKQDTKGEYYMARIHPGGKESFAHE